MFGGILFHYRYLSRCGCQLGGCETFSQNIPLLLYQMFYSVIDINICYIVVICYVFALFCFVCVAFSVTKTKFRLDLDNITSTYRYCITLSFALMSFLAVMLLTLSRLTTYRSVFQFSKVVLFGIRPSLYESLLYKSLPVLLSSERVPVNVTGTCALSTWPFPTSAFKRFPPCWSMYVCSRIAALIPFAY